MFKTYTLTDGMVGDLVATHNEQDAHVYANALEADYSELWARDLEVAVLIVEDPDHVPADVIGSEARVVREHTITATAAAAW